MSGGNHIVLVACASGKKSQPMLAKDLYSSTLFNYTRCFAESFGDRWYILSAKHGLLSPDDKIDPYDVTLNKKGRSERKKWAKEVFGQLKPVIAGEDLVTILAGCDYRQFLVPMLQNASVQVNEPLNGLGIGEQLQWLKHTTQDTQRISHLERVYKLLNRLDSIDSQFLRLKELDGNQEWPERGVYIVFNPEETRSIRPSITRIVRVGTHAVSSGSKSRLWTRIRAHRGTERGTGNHRGSVFRRHIGEALLNCSDDLDSESWGEGQSAPKSIREKEEAIERAVSEYVGELIIAWISVNDPPGPESDRAYIERSLVSLISYGGVPIDRPSPAWLGRYSPYERIRRSGLWNLDYVGKAYDRRFLKILEYHIERTCNKDYSMVSSQAPENWSDAVRDLPSRSQLGLFE